MPKRTAKRVEAVEPKEEEEVFDKEQNIVRGLRFEERIRNLDTELEQKKNQLQKVRIHAAFGNFWLLNMKARNTRLRNNRFISSVLRFEIF
jgi:hypothetical protein